MKLQGADDRWHLYLATCLDMGASLQGLHPVAPLGKSDEAEAHLGAPCGEL